MHPKSLIIGVVIGVALASGIFLLFGHKIRSNVASATAEVGESMQEVGEDLEDASKKLE